MFLLPGPKTRILQLDISALSPSLLRSESATFDLVFCLFSESVAKESIMECNNLNNAQYNNNKSNGHSKECVQISVVNTSKNPLSNHS